MLHVVILVLSLMAPSPLRLSILSARLHPGTRETSGGFAPTWTNHRWKFSSMLSLQTNWTIVTLSSLVSQIPN